jgi:protease I
MSRLKGKRILVVIAHEVFRDEEYQIPRKVFEAEGAEVVVASTHLGPAKGKLGLEVRPDVLLENVSSDEYDAVVFVGGAGCKNYWDDESAHAIARGFYESRKVTAAICSAPIILAKAGILRGAKAACFPDDKEELRMHRVEYVDDDVWINGNVVTAKGYWASSDFADAVVSQLQRSELSGEE